MKIYIHNATEEANASHTWLAINTTSTMQMLSITIEILFTHSVSVLAASLHGSTKEPTPGHAQCAHLLVVLLPVHKTDNWWLNHKKSFTILCNRQD